MNKTYTLTEGNDALNRVLLMMRYELGKTLDEQKILTDHDFKKYQRDEYENATRKYVDKTAVSFRGPDGKQKSTATFPKQSKGIQRVEAKSLSEALLEVREFFFTPYGATLQIVLSIAGSEIGLPFVFLLLDTAIIINDAYIMVRDWDSNGPKISYEAGPMGDIRIEGLWEWFSFHWDKNVGFQNLIIDIGAILLGQGIFKLGKATLKSSSKMFKYFIEKIGPDFMKKFIKFLESFAPKTEKLPKDIKSFVDRKFSEINKVIDLWKSPERVVKSVTNPKRLILAGVTGTGTYKLMKWFETKIEKINKFFNDNPEKNSVMVVDDLNSVPDKQKIDAILEDNSDLFGKNFEVKSFKTILYKKDKSGLCYVKYFLINGVKYYPIDLTKSFKLQKK